MSDDKQKEKPCVWSHLCLNENDEKCETCPNNKNRLMKVTEFIEYAIGEVDHCPICNAKLIIHCKTTGKRGKVSHRIETIRESA